jgi:hypothetical protein
MKKRSVSLWRNFLSRRVFFIATTIGTLMFTTLIGHLPKLIGFVTGQTSIGRTEQIATYVQDELQFLLRHARELSKSQELIDAIGVRDTNRIAALAESEGNRRGIDGILVTDREGIAFSRSFATEIRGDYTFHTSPWGERLSRGEEVIAVDRGAIHPLMIFAGVPIYDGSEMVGTIVAAFPLYDEYVQRFRDTHLQPEEEVIFYRQDGGLIGSSFDNPSDRRAAVAYFSSGSDFIQCCKKSELLRFGDKTYVNGNVLLPGVTEDIGGMIVLYPVLAQSQRMSLVLAATIFLLVALSFFAWRRGMTLPEVKWTLLICGVAFFIALQVFFALLGGPVRRSGSIGEQPIYNSTLRFDPEAGVLDRNLEHSIAIKLETGGEAVNAAKIIVRFDPQKLRVNSIVSTNSICSQGAFFEKTINNDEGIVIFSCGLLNPGFSEPIGTLAELIVQPLSEARFTLNFIQGTSVLANDGLATDVLRAWINGGYRAVERSTDDPMSAPLIIFSQTHPNSERWYSKRIVRISWLRKPGLTYTFIAPGIPEENAPASRSFIEIPISADGAYSINLFAWKDGVRVDEVELPVKIDAIPPEDLELKVSSKDITAGDVVRVEASAHDALSGLQQNVYAQIDGGIFLPVKLPLAIPLAEEGVHTITVRVFDNAENYTESTALVHVRSRSSFLERLFHELFPAIFRYASVVLSGDMFF